VVGKLKKLQRQLDDGLPAPDMKMTVTQLLNQWHEDVLRHQVAASAALSYWTIAKHHIIPILGSKRIVNLTTVDVDRLLSAKLDSGLSVSTVQRIRASWVRPSIKAFGGVASTGTSHGSQGRPSNNDGRAGRSPSNRHRDF